MYFKYFLPQAWESLYMYAFPFDLHVHVPYVITLARCKLFAVLLLLSVAKKALTEWPYRGIEPLYHP